MADEDARTYIQVKCQEWSQGDPEVSVKYVDGETINRYRFRVTDQDRQECSYKGEDPNELPVEVQHAVYSFGYSIRDLESITQWMFRLVEAKEILERLRQLEDEYEDLPLIHFLLRDTISVFDTLTGFLAARAILPRSRIRVVVGRCYALRIRTERRPYDCDFPISKMQRADS